MKDLWKTTSIKKKPGKDRFRRRELPETTGEEGEQRRAHQLPSLSTDPNRAQHLWDATKKKCADC